ncbi:unnamed protein product [Soboliphyme baturini]|uniref:Thymidylate synthase n=1 Tax=Soboliphyme baturini TaxID=241478 RepID=A0A3P8F834_9BILA|nr:unnamed protein product [Soboliphyme baturini]
MEELNYLNQLKYILENGKKKADRTGVGSVSVFGLQSRYNLRNDSFPLFTTKKVFWKGIIEELLWFIAGRTNSKLLSEKGVRIWDANSSREFLDSVSLQHYEEGDLGPVYGFQWRHFGAEYKGMYQCYDGQGVDQLRQCINLIKHDPMSRRIMLTAWNPCDLSKMALPPCHCLVQFYVADSELSCQMYQRSADMVEHLDDSCFLRPAFVFYLLQGLGVPFNVASYSLLTRMIASITGLKAGDFVHTIGDAHVYLNHVDAVKQQIERCPRPFPKLVIKRKVTAIEEFTAQDFDLIGYDPHPPIHMKMAL